MKKLIAMLFIVAVFVGCRDARIKEEKRNELFKELELKNEDLYAKPKIRTPTQLQKLVTTEDWEAINQFVIKPMGKPTLVPITDNRPEYKQNSIEDDFAEHVNV